MLWLIDRYSMKISFNEVIKNETNTPPAFCIYVTLSASNFVPNITISVGILIIFTPRMPQTLLWYKQTMKNILIEMFYNTHPLVNNIKKIDLLHVTRQVQINLTISSIHNSHNDFINPIARHTRLHYVKSLYRNIIFVYDIFKRNIK